MSRSVKVLLTIAVVAGGIGFLAYQSLGEVAPYAHVDEVLANPDKYVQERVVQVHGFAHHVPAQGAMVGDLSVTRFDLESKGKTIAVSHAGVTPDTFKEEAETVVTGKLERTPEGGYLLTTVGGERGIMAKCPSKYDGKK
ncbi:MAG TPA: cytochrome c maturation protein CcmE [Haliangiales bacterium]|nr:cytochrome c maturation protein CcmE [Haliangiales bacterium]